MIDSVKMYMAMALAAIVAVFLAVFKYRGSKIDSLEDDLDNAADKAAVVDKKIASTKKKTDFEANNRVAAAKAEARDYENITEHFYNI